MNVCLCCVCRVRPPILRNCRTNSDSPYVDSAANTVRTKKPSAEPLPLPPSPSTLPVVDDSSNILNPIMIWHRNARTCNGFAGPAAAMYIRIHLCVFSAHWASMNEIAHTAMSTSLRSRRTFRFRFACQLNLTVIILSLFSSGRTNSTANKPIRESQIANVL